MAAKTYVDPLGYWIDPERNVRRMGDEGGEQEIIIKATENCSDAERLVFFEALNAAIRFHRIP
jgi:hypothetical protein